MALIRSDANIGAAVSILMGNGDGTFREAQHYLGSWTAIASGDFNHDRHLDLATWYSGTVSVFLGSGDGTFARTEYTSGYPDEGLPGSFLPGAAGIAVSDFNGDSNLDLLSLDVTSASDAAVSGLLGNGDGTFQASRDYLTPSNDPYSAVVGDFNGDGKLDVAFVTETYTSGTYPLTDVSVLLGNGDGTFKIGKSTSLGQGALPPVARGDFNGDGNLDLVLPCISRVGIVLGNGDGTFQPNVNYPAGQGSQMVAVGDFNGDGKLDLVTANSRNLSLLLGNGDGAPDLAVLIPSTPFDFATFVSRILDILFAGGMSWRVSVSEIFWQCVHWLCWCYWYTDATVNHQLVMFRKSETSRLSTSTTRGQG